MGTHALVVGIDNYPGRADDLSWCVADAMFYARLFGRRGRGTRRDSVDACPFFGNADTIKLLINRHATRRAILTSLTWLLKRLEPGDLGIFAYSGHGTYVLDDSGDEADGFDEAIYVADGRVVIDDEFATRLERRAPGSRFLAITDSCNSGTNMRSFGPRLLGPVSREHRVRFLPPARLPESERYNRSHTLQRPPELVDVIQLPACLANQFAAESPEIKHGAYTYYFRDAILSLEPGATFRDLTDAISARLPNDEFEQQPVPVTYGRALDWQIPLRS